MFLYLYCYVDKPLLLCWHSSNVMLVVLYCYVGTPLLLCWYTSPCAVDSRCLCTAYLIIAHIKVIHP